MWSSFWGALYLAYALDKPVHFFFPESLVPMAPEETLGAFKQELLLVTRELDDDDLRRLVAVARAFASLTRLDG